MSHDVETRIEDGKLHVSRVYDAPREAVFDAWIATHKLEQWWGCAQTTAVSAEIECKVGGKFNQTMTLDNGHVMPGEATFSEYDPPKRLVFGSPGPTGEPMTISVDFTEVDGGTLVHLVHSGIPDMQVDGDIEMHDIIRGGWTAAFGKLAGFLETTASAS